MIARFVIGSGSARQTVDMERGRDNRRSAGGALKRHLFPTNASFGRAKRRGQRALGAE